MKKVLVGLISVLTVSALLLSACGSSGDAPKQDEKTTAEEISSSGADAPVVGGWTVNEEIVTPVLSEESKAAFDQAIQSYVGMNLEPAALLATQIVAGTNYLYLCKGEAVVQEPEPGWYMVVVYQDLEGKAEITSVTDIDMMNIKTAENVQEPNLAGGWQVVAAPTAKTLPEKAQAAFTKATEGYTGVTLSPFALLATQLVAGTNYMVFCHGTTVTAEPVDSLYIATVYEDLEGNAEFTDVQLLDLSAYLK